MLGHALATVHHHDLVGIASELSGPTGRFAIDAVAVAVKTHQRGCTDAHGTFGITVKGPWQCQ